MKKYRITFYYEGVPAPQIDEVEIERETESSIWVDGNRFQKRSEYRCFFDTWEEAHERLLYVANLRVKSARKSIERYEQILAMRKPGDAERREG